ncbi:MFS transporter [Paenibacillus cellulosilyticus]|nr:MFS transporter [Paenibacillus cellulosilyticus]QKS45115.1 MFS transporter [Paenibacillus cellulosilyticus]
MSGPFLRLYLLTLFYFSANAILNVVIPLKGESLGVSNTRIGIIMGVYLLTTMVCRPWAGYLIARYGPIQVLRIILTLNGLALLLYAFTDMNGYFAARIVQGICTAFFSMALQLSLIDALPDEERSQGISMYSLCSYLPGIIGPLLAIGMWNNGEGSLFAASMIVIACMTGVVGYTVRIRTQPVVDNVNSSSNAGITMLRSMRQLVHNPNMARSSILMLIASVIFGAVTAFMPLYAPRIHGGSAAIYLMIQAAVVVVIRFLFKSKMPSDGKWHSLFIAGILLLQMSAALCIGLAASLGVAVLYAGALLMGSAQALLYPTLTSYLSFVLPRNERSVLIGLFIAIADLGVAIGGIVMGPVADHFSYSYMYLLCAVLSAGVLFIAFDRAVLRSH